MMLEDVLKWCQGKASAKIPPRSKRKGHDDGYRAGYRDCALFIAEWIEESGEVDQD